MNPLKYLQKNGIRKAFRVLWCRKVPPMQVRIAAALTRYAPLRKTIIIECHYDFNHNGGAFYRWLLERGLNETHEIVWLLHGDLKCDLPRNVKAYRMHAPSWGRALAICRATWLLFEGDAFGKVREDQTSVYLTHGAFPLKNTKNTIGTFVYKCDYILNASEHVDGLVAEQYCLPNRGDGRFIHIGFPCFDQLLEPGSGAFGKALGLPRSARIIMWMPTYRKLRNGKVDGESDQPLGIPLISNMEEYRRIDDLLERTNIHLVIKLHPYQSPSVTRPPSLKHISVMTNDDLKLLGFDTYDVLKEADALISDYSSITYEYMILNRPVAFDLSDIDKYTRGLCVSNPKDYMPGDILSTVDSLQDFISEVSMGRDPHKDERERFTAWLFSHRDRLNCQRLADFLGIR